MNKIYKQEEVLEKSTEYFKGDTLAADVFVKKYALKNDKLEFAECNPDQMHHRIAKEFARIEKKYPNPLSEEEIYSYLKDFKYVVPGGSPMFGIGNTHQTVSLSNCFVIDLVDSYGGICRADERIAQISKRRGGVGLDISVLRPKGMPTKNSALTTDGVGVFMERFSNTAREVAQHGRRGALLLSISVHHPEIMTFIKIKRDLKKVTGANISIRVTDEFMDAVKKDKNYELRWPVDAKEPKISNKIKAKEVWDEIIKSVYTSAEPGVLFWDTIIKNSAADSYEKTISTNPCLVGDTLVYVADGRGNISLKQLAQEGIDVPVFCYNNDGKIVVRKMRHPRITGYKQKIYKIVLDDGYTIRCTGNHKIRLKDGSYKEAQNLISGESLDIITKFEASIKDIFSENNSKAKDYYWIAKGWGSNVAEHRVIASSFYNKDIITGQIVHHKDYNSKNNSPNNLVIIDKKEHDKMHCLNMFGDKNPMRRAKHEWSKEKLEQYSKNMSVAVEHEKNGRYLDITNEELLEKAVEFTKSLGHRFSKKEWQQYARKNSLPIEFSSWRNNVFGGLLGLSKLAAIQCGFKYIDEDPRLVKTLSSMLSQGYESKIENNMVFVKKSCEGCGKEFWINHLRREISYCNIQCAGKHVDRNNNVEKSQLWYKNRSVGMKTNQCNVFTYLRNKLSRIPMRKEWEKECKLTNTPRRLGTKYGFKDYADLKEKSQYFNHRVVSVELDSIEDVYNGTVDEFHNFFIGGFESKTKSNKCKWVYVNNLQCGELPLAVENSCILMSLNLSSYVDNPFTKDAVFNKEKFSEHVKKAQRLIDDLVDLEIEALEKIIKKVESDPEDELVKANELSLWKGIKDNCVNYRRTGLGITALGDCIAMLNLKYGSNESIKIVDLIYSTLRNEAYRNSIILAKERGKFLSFDHNKEKDNEYLNRLPDDIKTDMKKHGRRNVALLTTPPAGSLSVLTQTSSGFEPVFKAEYNRKRKVSDKEKFDSVDDMGDKWKHYTVSHHGLQLYKKITGKEFKDSPYYGSQAEDIDYNKRIEMQAKATFYNDHAISSTINVPKDIHIEKVAEIYMKAWEQGCKGITVYRQGSRDGVLTEVGSNNNDKKPGCADCSITSEELTAMFKNGIRPAKMMYSASPKRTDIVECDIHRSKVGGGDWMFFVGLFDGAPYEVFGGDSEKFTFPIKFKKGWIVKNSKVDGVTQYNLVIGSLDDENEKFEFKGITKLFNNKEYGAFTRLTSLAIRHGVPIKHICEQIVKNGVEGDLFSFQRAMSRILKKYIFEGEKCHVECPECHSNNVIYKGGCPSCQECGYSQCS